MTANNLQEQLLAHLPREIATLVQQYLKEELLSADRLGQQVRDYLVTLETIAAESEFVDLDLARNLGNQCITLLENYGSREPERMLIQAAIIYLIEEDDVESDTSSPIGFDDDAIVVNEVSRILGLDAEATK